MSTPCSPILSISITIGNMMTTPELSRVLTVIAVTVDMSTNAINDRSTTWSLNETADMKRMKPEEDGFESVDQIHSPPVYGGGGGGSRLP